MATTSTSLTGEAPAISRQGALDAYRQMLTIRRFEERVGQLYAMGQIAGFCHLSIGREAVIVGMASAATDCDQVITSHRCHGHALAQGCDPKAVMAELLGRASGLNGGKGGSLHLMAPQQNFFGGHGIVGAPASLAAGLAFANRYRDKAAVTVCTIGQGAVDQGQVYEAFNLAQRWQLPIVYVIDNDTGETGHGEAMLASRGAAFGITGWQVDGVDLAAVQASAKRALAMARGGSCPVILEMLTYPFRGHATPDAGNSGGKSRSLEEIDPVAHMKARLVSSGFANDDEIKAIDREVRAIVRGAATYAQDAAMPVAAELKRNLMAPAE